jgi:hypothetical protein
MGLFLAINCESACGKHKAWSLTVNVIVLFETPDFESTLNIQIY